MNEATETVDLAFSRWGSDWVVQGVMEVLGVLTGAALISWAMLDAVTSHRLDNGERAVLVAIGLIVTGYFGWLLRDFRTFMRSRLLVGAAGVQLDAGGGATYPWAQIAGFDVTGPDDVMGVPCAGAVMRMRDGRRIPLQRLDHAGGDGRNSKRAVAKITERVATMNRMLADATPRP